MEDKELKGILYSGDIYDSGNNEIIDIQQTYIAKVNEYNLTTNDKDGRTKREQMLPLIFHKCGINCYIEPPFHANFGGHNVSLGDNFYANFNLTLVDDGEIIIGDNVMIAPNVTIASATHPISPTLRKHGLQYNLPVHIGNNVWIGAGSIILPGVSIGANTVIGAGSVVTKDIPSDVVAYGNPCRVRRKITEKDLVTYNHDKTIPDTILERYK